MSVKLNTKPEFGILRKMFIPDFIYEYRTPLFDSDYLNKISTALELKKLKILSNKNGAISFVINSSFLFGVLSVGQIRIDIKKIRSPDFLIRVIFLTYKKIYIFFACALTLVFILDFFRSGLFFNLLRILIIPIGGYLIFFIGFLPAKIKKIQRFIEKLGSSA